MTPTDLRAPLTIADYPTRQALHTEATRRCEMAAREIERLRGLLDAASVDPAIIEANNRRWHGEDHRVIAVRWEPYKPDGVRQRGVKGRWQEQTGSGDFWKWVSCDRPVNLKGVRHERA